MKVVAAPNAFKGSMTGFEAAQAISRGIKRVSPDIEVVCMPVADGGDGLAQVMCDALDGEIQQTTVCGPLNDQVAATFCTINSGKTAVVEMAQASGLVLIPNERQDPEKTSTYGTGELIRKCLDIGVERLIIGLGGSATCDGGIGAAAALGYAFLDKYGKNLVPTGENLTRISSIDTSRVDKRLFDVVVEGVCDVTNILTGPDGASYVYSPQKGASEAQVKSLDEGLRNLASVIHHDMGVDIENLPGAGAAGGLGGGVHAFMNGNLQKGIDLVIDLLKLQDLIKDADLVITGEGSIDDQTANDKAPAGVAKIAHSLSVPCLAIAGSIGDDLKVLHEIGIKAIFSLCRGPINLETAMAHGPGMLEDASEQVVRLFLTAQR